MSTNTNTPGSTVPQDPNPFQQFGVPAITQHMIDAMRAVAAAENASAIIDYNNQVESVAKNNATNKSLGIPLVPVPQPPMLKVVNTALIAQNESEVFAAGGGTAVDSDKQDWDIFFEVPYVPVVPPAPTHPAIVVNLDAFEGPGLYGADGDGPDVPAGTVVAGPGGVGSFRKTVIGRSPFAPGGVVTAWQQIG